MKKQKKEENGDGDAEEVEDDDEIDDEEDIEDEDNEVEVANQEGQ